MARTLQATFQAALEEMGAKVTPYNSGRYVVLTRPQGGYYFLGSAGSLRVGACVARSIPCGQKFRDLLLCKGTVTCHTLGVPHTSPNVRVALD